MKSIASRWISWLFAGCLIWATGCNGEAARSECDQSEVPYDGLDNDCDPATPDDDLDGDGFLMAVDCDDTEALRNPALEESSAAACVDGLDNDCDGKTDEQDADCSGCNNDAQCEDGLYCNGAESCVDGRCVHAGDPCAGGGECADTCDEAADSCLAPAGTGCDDGLYCNGHDTCAAGSCSQHAGDPCDAGAQCFEDEDACRVVVEWVGLDGSDFGPWIERISWGSAGGGGISSSADLGLRPVAAVDGSGNPVVAWRSAGTDASVLRVSRFDGTDWEEIGGGLASHLKSGSPSLVVDLSGRSLVAWSEPTAEGSEIYLRQYDPATGEWLEVGSGSASDGGISNNDADSESPSLALDPDGQPVVAWLDNSSGKFQVFIKRLDPDANAWVEVGGCSAIDGGISGSTGSVGDLALAVDSQGRPWVTWADSASGDWQIYLRWFDPDAGEGTWVEAGTGSAADGGVSGSSGDSYRPRLVIDSIDRPVLAWVDNGSGNAEVYVKRFDPNESQWLEIGPDSAANGGVSQSTGSVLTGSLAVDEADQPVVAWMDMPEPGLGTSWSTNSQTNHEVLVKRYDVDGDAWVDMGVGSGARGGVSDNANASRFPSLAVGSAGQAVLAWEDHNEVLVKRFDAGLGEWTGLGPVHAEGSGISQTSGWSYAPSLVLDDQGDPLVTWLDTSPEHPQVFIRAHDPETAAWVEVGADSANGDGISLSDGGASSPSLALGADGDPLVAWHDVASGTAQIYIKQTNGQSWVALGTGSATGGGISDTTGGSYFPSLALDPDGNPVVAWSTSLGAGNYEIYVRRFDGISGDWLEVGAGSATGGGVSDNPGNSASPSLAIDSTGAPVVAWNDNSHSNTYQIYVRRYDADADAWLEVGVDSATGGGISATAARSASASLALTGGDLPIVAWEEEAAGVAEIWVKRFDGRVWVEAGPGAASGGGVSSSPGASGEPHLAVDSQDRPVVAWTDESFGQTEIYIRRYDPARGDWQEVGDNSASAGGISNSAANSYNPSLAISADDRICVAWSEWGMDVLQIALRCALE